MAGVIQLKTRPYIRGFGSVAGKKEHEGPLRDTFDIIKTDVSLGQDSWEDAESLLQQNALRAALQRAGLRESDPELIFAGDLLNQCTAAGYAMRGFDVPFAGVYGACSTMALSGILASLAVDGGYANVAAAVTSSHFCSAERQFRKPLEYGGQRPQTAQWTATGAGCLLFGNEGKPTDPRAVQVIFGKVRDLGVTDENNMGAAMAPAACDTIGRFLQETRTSPEDYDLILTGDLGAVGTPLLYELMRREYGVELSAVHKDCGLLLYDRGRQDVHAGGSGCGCSAIVLCGSILPALCTGKLRRVLFVATGALLSPTRVLQGESIPGIAHGILLTGGQP